MEIKLNEVQLDEIETLEETVTPAWGVICKGGWGVICW